MKTAMPSLRQRMVVSLDVDENGGVGGIVGVGKSVYVYVHVGAQGPRCRLR